MTKKMTIEDLAQLTEERAQGLEKKMDETKRDITETKDLVKSVLELVENIDGKIGDLQKSTASAREVAIIEQRVETLEGDVRKIKQKVKI